MNDDATDSKELGALRAACARAEGWTKVALYKADDPDPDWIGIWAGVPPGSAEPTEAENVEPLLLPLPSFGMPTPLGAIVTIELMEKHQISVTYNESDAARPWVAQARNRTAAWVFGFGTTVQAAVARCRILQDKHP